jgi:hypothetical protein
VYDTITLADDADVAHLVDLIDVLPDPNQSSYDRRIRHGRSAPAQQVRVPDSLLTTAPDLPSVFVSFRREAALSRPESALERIRAWCRSGESYGDHEIGRAVRRLTL